jgi:D-glycero-alpha-D-manno-heptose-7-phosphate kinase
MNCSVRAFLTEHEVEASAPCRIDSGGTWDIKALALPFQRIRPVTLNIALNLRTSVVLSPHKDGRVSIFSEGFTKKEEFHKDEIHLNSRFGLFFGAISYFGFHGLEVHIRSRSPVKSALGGSSTALVALIKALASISHETGGKKLSAAEIVHLAYHLEDSVATANCGIQDHAAAVYGGVNQWNWHYGDRTAPFERISLLDRKGQKELSRHILVAYSGKAHISSNINRNWIRDFLSGRTRVGWIKVNEIIQHLARSIQNKDWKRAAGLLQEEMALRGKLTPESLIPITKKLVGQAVREGCGARFAGAGAGGSLWALGGMKNIQRLRRKWEETLAPVKGGKILDCQVDTKGVSSTLGSYET